MQVTISVAIMQVLMLYCNYGGGNFCCSYVGGFFCSNHAGNCFYCNYAVRSLVSNFDRLSNSPRYPTYII